MFFLLTNFMTEVRLLVFLSSWENETHLASYPPTGAWGEKGNMIDEIQLLSMVLSCSSEENMVFYPLV